MRTIRFNNYAEKKGSREIQGREVGWYKFEVFVDPLTNIKDINDIDYIEYHLHKNIPNPYRVVTDRSSGFALEFYSWESFFMTMIVRFKDETEQSYRHMLDENNPFPAKPL